MKKVKHNIKELTSRNLTFLYGENGAGKSTLAREISEKTGWHYYNPMQVYSEKLTEIAHGGSLLGGTGIDFRDSANQMFTSDGENYFHQLMKWLESHKGNIILDEPDKGFSMTTQWNFWVLLNDLLKEGRKIIVISHSYIVLKHAINAKTYIYDVSTGEEAKDFMPPF